MKNISIYRPTTVDEAIQILSRHGTEAGVYAGGTDLLIRLKNRLKQAPTYLVDIKKIDKTCEIAWVARVQREIERRGRFARGARRGFGDEQRRGVLARIVLVLRGDLEHAPPRSDEAFRHIGGARLGGADASARGFGARIPLH